MPDEPRSPPSPQAVQGHPESIDYAIDTPIGRYLLTEFSERFCQYLGDTGTAIKFPELCDTSPFMPGGQPLRVRGVEIGEHPSSEVISATTNSLGTRHGKGIIQVIGGASQFPLDEVPTMEELLRGVYDESDLPKAFHIARDIYRSSCTLGANLITGGTQSGIMALISKMWCAQYVLDREMITRAKSLARIQSATPSSIYRSNAPDLIHVVPKKLAPYLGNDSVIDQSEWPCPLAPCTGFIAVENGAGWGSAGDAVEASSFVQSYLPAYDRAVAYMGTNAYEQSHLPNADRIVQCLAKEYDHRRVAVIINGGNLTMREALLAVDRKDPASLIALEGTGRFADLLSTCIRNDYTLPTDDHAIWKDERIIKDAHIPGFKENTASLLQKLEYNALHHRGYAYIAQAGEEGLTSRIQAAMLGTRM